MKTKFFIQFFLLLPFLSYSQDSPTRFSITPYFGLGMNLPGKQTVNSGSQRMAYGWKAYKFGQYYFADGTSRFALNTTNRLGFSFGYDLSEKIQLRVGGNRMDIVTAYKPPFTYDSNGITVVSFEGNISYLNMTSGLKYNFGNSYLNLDFQYTPNIFKQYFFKNTDTDNSIDYSDHRNSAGTGLKFERLSYTRQIPSLYVALGEEIDILGGNANIEIGLNLGFRPYETEKSRYYQNFTETGSSTIKYGTNAIFISLTKPIYFKKKEKEVTEEEAEIPKKQQITFGKKTVLTGENLVLENINFEQTKSVLDPSGMRELDTVFDLLIRYPNSIIELTGHTSNEGNRNDNIELSKRRAEACRAYLIRKGIKPNRIKAYGLGPDRPISTTEKDKNRRVEVKVLSIN